MSTTQSMPSQAEIFNQRLPFVIIAMLVMSAILVLKMISFQQLSPDVVTELSPDYNRAALGR